MITTPDRISQAIEQVERGEAVDWGRLRVLSALDLVQAGRRFVEAAILRDEQFDSLLLDPARGGELVLPEFAVAEVMPLGTPGANASGSPLGASGSPGGADALGVRLPASVLNVHDGDTVRVSFGGLAVDVRLLDCWTPELSEPRGVEARDALRALLAVGQRVTVWVPAPNARKDGLVHLADLLTFGRVLGRILVGGRDMSQAMVAAGWGTVTKPAGTVDGGGVG